MPKKKVVPRRSSLGNTVTLNLNGSDAQILASYNAAQAHMRYWFFCRSQFRVRVGNHIMYTTPSSGTFYYAVTYQGRWIVFVIIARIFWLVGFYNEHGVFQMLFENRLYMDHPDVVLTGFSGNHGEISGANVEETRLGPSWMRRGLKDISMYRGPGHHSKAAELRSDIGRFVTLLMESKYGELFRRCCGSISGDASYKRLGGDGADDMVHGWAHRSNTAMELIAQGYGSAEEVQEAFQIFRDLYILQLDAYNEKMFKHQPLPPVPRTDVWDPIDDGTGDPLIGQPQTRQPRFEAPHTLHRNAARRTAQDSQKKRLGLRGGRAGGACEAPKWFMEWNQGEDDATACDLVVAGASSMGLKVIEAQLIVQSNNATSKDAKESKKDISKGKPPLGSNKESNSIDQVKNQCKSPAGSSRKEGNFSGKDRTKSKISEDAKDSEQDMNLGKSPPGRSSIRESDLSEQDRNLAKSPPGRSSMRDSKQDRNLAKSPPGRNSMRDSDFGEQDRNLAKSPPGSSNSSSSSKERYFSEKDRRKRSKNAKESEQDRNMGKNAKESDDKKIKEALELEEDLAELRGSNYIGDRTINMFLRHLAETYGDDLISFVSVENSHLLAHGSAGADALDFNLTSPLFTLFPVNDNENNVYGEGNGNHWSLLILDNSGALPRFVHHDSFHGANSGAARRLADSIRRMVPHTEEGITEPTTPMQGNGWDCGIFVMAMARSIARWWASDDGGDWMGRLDSEVNSGRVATLRLQLVEVLLGRLTLQDLEKEL